MMINLCKVPVGKTHKEHKHETMEEIFYFTQGNGEVKIDNETNKVIEGDRIIVPATKMHSVKNLGKKELKYIGLGIALD